MGSLFQCGLEAQRAPELALAAPEYVLCFRFSGLLSQWHFGHSLHWQAQGKQRTLCHSFAMPNKMATKLLGQDGAGMQSETMTVFLGREAELKQTTECVWCNADS
jgi:hypothetical protein